MELAAWQESRPTILLLDNVDQHMASVLALSSAAVGESDVVRIVYTSQVPLGVAGECVWRVPQIACNSERVPRLHDSTSEALLLFSLHGGRLPMSDIARKAALRDIDILVDEASGLPLAAVLTAFASRRVTRWSRTALEKLIWGRTRSSDADFHGSPGDLAASLDVPLGALAERHESLAKAYSMTAKRNAESRQSTDSWTDVLETDV